ncbi:hypothetical protein F5887DRAFT_1172457 [Amanita rubescens]|nr:hypothetical protein F5887DRAFT_1172457 [Amanita rubescens]
MLTVCIGLVTERTKEVLALCKLLEEYNAQIREFALTAHTVFLAGGVVYDIFPNVGVFQALEVLSILSESESDYLLNPEWPRLDMVLADATNTFPNLQKLHMNSFYDCVPMLPPSSSFSHLKSLWMKHYNWQNHHDVTPPTASGVVKGRPGSEISLDIRLPRLRHLAVSVPGTACDLMGCITAPMVEDLHLDGSREPEFGRMDDKWSAEDTTTTCNALRLFASRCRNCTPDERGPPFPMLECIALHGIFDAEWSGFDDELLEKFARKPSLPLKRLALLYCDFPLQASTVVAAFRASGAKEFECDEDVPLWEAGEREQLEELGVSLTYWEAVGIDLELFYYPVRRNPANLDWMEDRSFEHQVCPSPYDSSVWAALIDALSVFVDGAPGAPMHLQAGLCGRKLQRRTARQHFDPHTTMHLTVEIVIQTFNEILV